MVDRVRAWEYTGAATVVVTTVSVLAATLVSPAFRWQGNALSNLGVTTTAAGTPTTVLLFNGGLIAGGVLGLAFAACLVGLADEWLVGWVFGVTVALLGLIGVFPQDHPYHFPVAAGFYLCITLTLWLDAAQRIRDGWRARAAVSFVLGAVNIGGLLLWGLTGPVARPGLAIPEMVGALAFGAWALSVSLDLFPARSPASNAQV